MPLNPLVPVRNGEPLKIGEIFSGISVGDVSVVDSPFPCQTKIYFCRKKISSTKRREQLKIVLGHKHSSEKNLQLVAVELPVTEKIFTFLQAALIKVGLPRRMTMHGFLYKPCAVTGIMWERSDSKFGVSRPSEQAIKVVRKIKIGEGSSP